MLGMRTVMLLGIICILILNVQVLAQDIEDLSLADLLNMEVTTASKMAEKLSDAPGVISVVTKDELRRFGGLTLSDILERIPSLAMTTAYFTDRSMIAARGDQIKTTSGHVLLLINGRPVRESLEGGITSEVFESFPVATIERIEVIKGPGSVLYGSNAFSSVINLIIEDANETDFSVSGFGGVSGTYGTTGHVKLKAGDVSVVGSIRLSEKKGWDVEYRNLDATSGDVVVRNITIPDKQTGSFAQISYKGLRVMTSYNEFENEYFVRGFFSQAKWIKHFNDVGYNLRISDNWRMDFNVTYTTSTLEADEYPFIERKSSDMVVEWTNFVSLSEKSKLVVGGLYNKVKGNEDYFGVPGKVISITDGNITSYGFYSQMDYRIRDNMKLIGGFQANKVEKIALDIVPRIGVIWYPVPEINIKALYSQAFRAPSAMEISIKHPGLLGNPDLVPEKVGTIDFGVSYNKDNLQAGINFFRSDMTNIINPDRSTQPGVYQNNGEVTFTGIEFESKFYLSQNFLITHSSLFQTNEDKDANRNVSPTPNLYSKIGFSYMNDNGLTLSVFDYIYGELDRKFDTTLNPRAKSGRLIDLYSNFDIKKLLKMETRLDFSAYLLVENALDQKMWLPEWGSGNEKETMPVDPGRRFYLGVNVSF